MAKAEKLEEAISKLREAIIRGDFGVRGSLPARATLEKELGIPHSTMSQVILTLQSDGLIAYSGNRRLTAIPPRKRVPTRDVSFTRFLREQGLEPITEYIESPERLPMDTQLAKAFGVPVGTLYVARIRRDGTKNMWYRITSKYFLSELIDDDTLAFMQNDNRYDAILDIKNKKNISAHFMTEDSYPRLPTPQEQLFLSIARYTPVEQVTRTCYDKVPPIANRVLWINYIVLVGHLFVRHEEYEGEALWKE